VARGIEESGISTVCVTFRRDIMELTRPPRILSLKFSVGKPLGNPGDKATQKGIIEAGFELLQRDISNMTTVELPFRLKKFGIF
jgi:D-proline reductase (dithiol) PrdB